MEGDSAGDKRRRSGRLENMVTVDYGEDQGDDPQSESVENENNFLKSKASRQLVFGVNLITPELAEHLQLVLDTHHLGHVRFLNESNSITGEGVSLFPQCTRRTSKGGPKGRYLTHLTARRCSSSS